MAITEIGIAVAMTKVERPERRKKSSTTIARMPPRIAESRTLAIACWMYSAVLMISVTLTSGKSSRMRSTSESTLVATWTVLAPDCLLIARRMPGSPSIRVSVVTSSTPSWTSAMSRR